MISIDEAERTIRSLHSSPSSSTSAFFAPILGDILERRKIGALLHSSAPQRALHPTRWPRPPPKRRAPTQVIPRSHRQDCEDDGFSPHDATA
jgi:hypothetical protein